MIRNSNAHFLLAALNSLGFRKVRYLGIVKDERETITAKIREGLACDFLLVSGGVSVGDVDIVPDCLAACGVRKILHKIAVKPGEPIFAGESPRGGTGGAGPPPRGRWFSSPPASRRECSRSLWGLRTSPRERSSGSIPSGGISSLMMGEAASPGFRFTREEISGSLGDLGTFLPLTLGYIVQCGLSPAPVFFFAGLWNVVTGFLFRLPIPVQPMKAIAAVPIAGDSRLVGGVAVTLIVLSYFRRKVPAALILFLLGFLLLGVSRPGLFGNMTLTTWAPEVIIPSAGDWWRGFTRGAVAQIPLTLLNSVVAACALSGGLFPGRKIPEAT